ncbi:MAG: sigma factor-like helix-turn-helix DNA-binding protein [Sphingomonas sp.]
MSARAGNARIRQRLVRALAQLPERQRAVYVALARDGLAYEALADRLGVGVDEIERDFAAALATLADAIDQPATPWRQRLVRWINSKGSK